MNDNDCLNGGYETKEEYFRCLADAYQIEYDVIVSIANTLGTGEDLLEEVACYADEHEDSLI